MLREWEKLPKFMQTEEVRPYYDSLKKKKISLALKRGFDVFAASVMLVTFSPVLIAISIMIVRDSNGGVFYRQERVTQYGRKFKIFKSEQWLLMQIKSAPRLPYPMTVELRG